MPQLSSSPVKCARCSADDAMMSRIVRDARSRLAIARPGRHRVRLRARGSQQTCTSGSVARNRGYTSILPQHFSSVSGSPTATSRQYSLASRAEAGGHLISEKQVPPVFVARLFLKSASNRQLRPYAALFMMKPMRRVINRNADSTAELLCGTRLGKQKFAYLEIRYLSNQATISPR